MLIKKESKKWKDNLDEECQQDILTKKGYKIEAQIFAEQLFNEDSSFLENQRNL